MVKFLSAKFASYNLLFSHVTMTNKLTNLKNLISSLNDITGALRTQ